MIENAEVLIISKDEIVVMCPYCGELHTHGGNGDATRDDYGLRAAHCKELRIRMGRSYRLVCTDSTIRKAW